MKPALVVLAAGIGSRYGGLKQMDPVGPSGEFIIDYSIFDALRGGFGKIVFVIRRDIEKDFRATIGARVEKQTAVDYAFQELANIPAGFTVPPDRVKPWGTGHAILACRKAVREPFGVINADDFYGAGSYAVLADFLQKTRDDARSFSMVGFILRNTLTEHGYVARGICQAGPDGCLKTVVERTKIEKDGDRVICADQALTGDELVSMNVWGFKPSLFDHLEEQFAGFLKKSAASIKAEFFIPDVVNTLIAGRLASVKILETNSSWFGVTYPQDKEAVVTQIRRLIQAGEYPESLWKNR